MRKAPPHSMWIRDHSRLPSFHRRARLHVAENTHAHSREVLFRGTRRSKAKAQTTGCQGLEQRKGLSSAKGADCHGHDCDALELGTVTDIQRGENI